MVTEALPRRRVEQVRRGVVALGGVPRRAIDLRQHVLTRPQHPLLDEHRERLVLAYAQDLLDASTAIALLAFDRAHVGDLAATRGVERRLRELDQIALAGPRRSGILPSRSTRAVHGNALHSPHGGLLLLGLIPGETGLKAAPLGECTRRPRRVGTVAGAALGAVGPAACALLLHQPLEVALDRQPLRGKKFAGHLI